MKSFFKFVLLLILCFGLLFIFRNKIPSDLIADTPSESDGKAAIEALLTLREDGGRNIKVKGIKKLDGVELNISGQKAYNMEYEAEVEFIEDTGYLLTCEGSFSRHRPHNWLPQAGGVWSDNKGKKGSVLKLNGILTFVKSEKGWKVTNPSNPC